MRRGAVWAAGRRVGGLFVGCLVILRAVTETIGRGLILAILATGFIFCSSVDSSLAQYEAGDPSHGFYGPHLPNYSLGELMGTASQGEQALATQWDTLARLGFTEDEIPLYAYPFQEREQERVGWGPCEISAAEGPPLTLIDQANLKLRRRYENYMSSASAGPRVFQGIFGYYGTLNLVAEAWPVLGTGRGAGRGGAVARRRSSGLVGEVFRRRFAVRPPSGGGRYRPSPNCRPSPTLDDVGYSQTTMGDIAEHPLYQEAKKLRDAGLDPQDAYIKGEKIRICTLENIIPPDRTLFGPLFSFDYVSYDNRRLAICRMFGIRPEFEIVTGLAGDLKIVPGANGGPATCYFERVVDGVIRRDYINYRSRVPNLYRPGSPAFTRKEAPTWEDLFRSRLCDNRIPFGQMEQPVIKPRK